MAVKRRCPHCSEFVWVGKGAVLYHEEPEPAEADEVRDPEQNEDKRDYWPHR